MQGEPLPEWVETDLLRTNTYTDKDGRERHDHVTMNRYFRTHPEMVLGDLDIVTGPFWPPARLQSEGRRRPGTAAP